MAHVRFASFMDLLQSAEKGSPIAARGMWGIYSSDDFYLNRQWGQTKMANKTKAEQWKKKAATLGHPEALLAMAREAFEKGAFAKASKLLHEALESKVFLSLDFEERHAIKQSCAEILEDVRMKLENKKIAKKTEENIEKLKGPEAYNRAVQLLAEAPTAETNEKIEKLLVLAAQKGVFQAVKLLKTLK